MQLKRTIDTSATKPSFASALTLRVFLNLSVQVCRSWSSGIHSPGAQAFTVLPPNEPEVDMLAIYSHMYSP